MNSNRWLCFKTIIQFISGLYWFCIRFPIGLYAYHPFDPLGDHVWSLKKLNPSPAHALQKCTRVGIECFWQCLFILCDKSQQQEHCSICSVSPFETMGTSEENEEPRPSDITVFGANSTLHGLSHIFLPGGVTIRRLLWAFAFLSSLSIFLYHVAMAVMEYCRYPHVTILDEMDSPMMFFPAITLCNYNSFRRSKMLRNDLFWMAGLLDVEQSDFDDFMAALGQPVDDSKFFPSKTFNMLEFVQRTSHNIEEMLLDCKYRGKDCGPENFTTVSKGLDTFSSKGKGFFFPNALLFTHHLPHTVPLVGFKGWLDP